MYKRISTWMIICVILSTVLSNDISEDDDFSLNSLLNGNYYHDDILTYNSLMGINDDDFDMFNIVPTNSEISKPYMEVKNGIL